MPELDIMEKDLNPYHHNKGVTEDSMINVFELIMTHYQLKPKLRLFQSSEIINKDRLSI